LDRRIEALLESNHTPRPPAGPGRSRLRSLRARLGAVWVLSLAAACAVGLLLVQLYQLSTSAQVERADAGLARACERIADRYGYYTAGLTAPSLPLQDDGLRRDLAAVVAVALSDSAGVEGGIWHDDSGPLAYAYPTYAGGGPKSDLPAAERPRIQAVNQDAAQNGRPEAAAYATGSQTVLLRACPLRGPVAGLTGWTMTRVAEATGWDKLRLGLGVLLALVLGLSAWLTWLVLAWTRHVGRIEAALAGAGDGDLPLIATTGEAELDRIVAALNTAGARLAEARRRGAELSARVAAAERLAALGRVAAGVAHEIRNPIAAMRLKAENALAGDPARRGAALEAMLAQIARLDRLLAELLAMTQRREPVLETVDIAALLHGAAADHRQDRIAMRIEASPAGVRVDPTLLRRALDALLDNALRHTPAGGSVTLRATHDGTTLRIEVADTGPGIAPALHASLFEPFVSGRADGTGLGLAIARELAEAQGGRLLLAHAGGDSPNDGAAFALELPCPPS
jgi:signal transduction histidine kinase